MALGPDDHDDVISVGLTINCTDESQVARVSEKLGLLAAGLALEGVNVTITYIKLDPPEEGWGKNG